MFNKIIITLCVLFFYSLEADAKHHHKKDKEKEFVNMETEAWTRACNMHISYADLYYKDAKLMCINLCNDQKILTSTTAPCEFINNEPPTLNLIWALRTYLTVLGLQNTFEWDFIIHRLNLCIYHIEMSEFYKSMLEDVYKAVDENNK